MRKDDARQLDHRTLEQLRIRSVKRAQAGESPEVISKTLGLNRSSIYTWLALYRDGGWNALKSKPTPGAKPKIDAKKMEYIFETVTMKNPQQLKFEFALWTREMIQKLIGDKFQIKLSLKAAPSRRKPIFTLATPPTSGPINMLGARGESRVKCPLWRTQVRDSLFHSFRQFRREDSCDL